MEAWIQQAQRTNPRVWRKMFYGQSLLQRLDGCWCFSMKTGVCGNAEDRSIEGLCSEKNKESQASLQNLKMPNVCKFCSLPGKMARKESLVLHRVGSWWTASIQSAQNYREWVTKTPSDFLQWRLPPAGHRIVSLSAPISACGMQSRPLLLMKEKCGVPGKVLLSGAKVYFLLVEGELFDDDRIRKCCLEKWDRLSSLSVTNWSNVLSGNLQENWVAR